MGGTQRLAPPEGKHRCLALGPWNFLNFCGQKGKGQRLSSTIYSARFPTNCSNCPADKARAFLVGKTHGGCLPGGHGRFQSFLQAAGGCLSPTKENQPHQPAEEGLAPDRAPSTWHHPCFFAVTRQGRNPGSQEVPHSPESQVPCRGSAHADA